MSWFAKGLRNGLRNLGGKPRMKWFNKTWGQELWLTNEPEYCAKYLYLFPGYRCSLHRHAIKAETFIVTQGECVLDYGGARRLLYPGDSQRIDPGVLHRFANERADFLCIILEISSHHDDSDVERLEPSGLLPPSAS